jgi:glycosyltransferase involved in cell wall biosynthesis
MGSNVGHRRLVVVSDYQAGSVDNYTIDSIASFERSWQNGERGDATSPAVGCDVVRVEGSYIERLPLACLKVGIVDATEIWTHWRGATPPQVDWTDAPHMLRFAFSMDGRTAPFSSNDMLAHISVFGPPDILCVWGLGVSEEILVACRSSFKIYNSIDAPAMRIPAEVSRHFDLVLTGAQWQSDEVLARHPAMKTAILPIGPEFASETMFYPLGGPKPYDVVYVAAAQSYKRHDILFNALTKLPSTARALCVFGYGEMGEDLRMQAAELGINIDFIGPPGVAYDEVNRLINLAKIGVVCGVDDGAPAILTEYMLAGLPVLANEELTCGLQYISPQTGRIARAGDFHLGLTDMLENLESFSPRQAVLDNWTWPHSVRKLRALISQSPLSDCSAEVGVFSEIQLAVRG